MKSTGEVLGVERTFEKALYKAFTGSGFTIPTYGAILATVADRDKEDAIKLLRKFSELGFEIFAKVELLRHCKPQEYMPKQ